MDTSNNMVSLLCKAEIRAGVWVRIELSSWILFGVVKHVVPIGTVGRCLGIHPEAAFYANQEDPTWPRA